MRRPIAAASLFCVFLSTRYREQTRFRTVT
jgi:hypothetical protein